MKRAGNLYPRIAEAENLRLAFFKAAMGKLDRPEVILFRAQLEQNLDLLRQQLISGELDIGHYRFFKVRDPKPRNICAASFPERVLHHAIMNICEQVFERYAIFDSVRHYFDSIDHKVMLNLLHRRLKDQQLFTLFTDILSTYHLIPGKGLPIGNLVSQHLANYYLGRFDHWVKEDQHMQYYLRYMDDFILFADTRQHLKQQLVDIHSFLDVYLKLQLKDNIQLNRCSYGVPFLGFRVYPHGVKFGTQSKKRFREKYQKCEKKYLVGVWTERELIRHIEPLFDWSFTALLRYE